MLTKNIRLKKFGIKKNKKKIKYRFLKSLNFYKNHKLIKSFSNNYSYDFSQHQIKKFKKFNDKIIYIVVDDTANDIKNHKACNER